MFDMRHLEVSVVIALVPLTQDAPALPPVALHQVRLETLQEAPEEITYAVENHLAEHVAAICTLVPDEDPDGGPSFTVMGPDGAPFYAVGITLHSRSLEPAISCEQWGVQDIAKHWSVSQVTIRSYLSRGKMPLADGYISGSPWWNADTIRACIRPGAKHPAR